MNPWIIGGSAAVGALKGHEDRKAWQRHQGIEAQRERWSPWTGVHGQNNPSPSALGNILQAAMAGAMFSQQNPGSVDEEEFTTYANNGTGMRNMWAQNSAPTSRGMMPNYAPVR